MELLTKIVVGVMYSGLLFAIAYVFARALVAVCTDTPSVIICALCLLASIVALGFAHVKNVRYEQPWDNTESKF